MRHRSKARTLHDGGHGVAEPAEQYGVRPGACSCRRGRRETFFPAKSSGIKTSVGRRKRGVLTVVHNYLTSYIYQTTSKFGSGDSMNYIYHILLYVETIFMRKPTDVCLLCRMNPATKRNSHIVPRFLSTAFLGGNGKPRRGYKIGEERKGVIQDSPKEDFILCDGCESYLGLVESIAASVFREWSNKVVTGEFTERIVYDFFKIVDCLNSHPSIVRLLVYSIFWRVSISSIPLFDDYRLDSKIEENLRLAVLSKKSTASSELKDMILNEHVPIYPYTAMTAQSFADGTANILMALVSQIPAVLHVDRFVFVLYGSNSDVPTGLLSEFANLDDNDCKIAVVPETVWHEQMVQRPLHMAAEQERRRKGQ